MREQTIMIDLLMVRNEGKLFIGTGCYSENFVGIAEQEITVADLLDMLMLGYAITYDDLRDSLYPVVKFDIKEYIDKLLCIDAITRNEDRHFRNISFIFKGGKYTPAKIYDNGAACFLDLLTYPMSMDIATCFQSVQAKPFSVSFKKQLQGVKPLRIRYEKYLDSIDVHEEHNVRINNVIRRGLKETEGLAWVRY